MPRAHPVFIVMCLLFLSISIKSTQNSLENCKRWWWEAGEALFGFLTLKLGMVARETKVRVLGEFPCGSAG